jgi:hypothetical protein
MIQKNMIQKVETFTNVRTGKIFINMTIDSPDVDMKLFNRVSKYYSKDPTRWVVKTHMSSYDHAAVKNEYWALIDLVNQTPKKSYHVKRQTSDATKDKMKKAWAERRETRSAKISEGMKRHYKERMKNKISEPKVKPVKKINAHGLSKEDIIDFFKDATNINQEVEYSLGMSKYLFKLRLKELFGTSSYKKVRTMLND